MAMNGYAQETINPTGTTHNVSRHCKINNPGIAIRHSIML